MRHESGQLADNENDENNNENKCCGVVLGSSGRLHAVALSFGVVQGGHELEVEESENDQGEDEEEDGVEGVVIDYFVHL